MYNEPLLVKSRCCLPMGLKSLQPTDALFLPPFHFQHMGHGVDGPGIRRIAFDGLPAGCFGRPVIAAFLQREATAGEERADAIRRLREKYPQYAAGMLADDAPVIRITPDRITSWGRI